MAEEGSGAESHGGPGFGPRRPRGGGKRFQGKPKVCLFCVERGQRVDYKQSDLLRRFVNDSGKIRPRRQTGTCARHQRLLSVAIKRARHLALLPFTGSPSR
ncbi:MAG TPA: 30S ribosomal protein S18 [Anaerolineae bacterium]|nr:30S ribosomal protein S18 [Anaerolineae bacterium]